MPMEYLIHPKPAASWVKKVGGTGSCNFLTDIGAYSYKFPNYEIMSAQNFNFAPNFPEMGVV